MRERRWRDMGKWKGRRRDRDGEMKVEGEGLLRKEGRDEVAI